MESAITNYIFSLQPLLQNSGINFLPDPILANILYFLHLPELQSKKLVCKHWKQVIIATGIVERTKLCYLNIFELPEKCTWKTGYELIRKNFFAPEPIKLPFYRPYKVPLGSIPYDCCQNGNYLFFIQTNDKFIGRHHLLTSKRDEIEIIKRKDAAGIKQLFSHKQYIVAVGNRHDDIFIMNAESLNIVTISNHAYNVELFAHDNFLLVNRTLPNDAEVIYELVLYNLQGEEILKSSKNILCHEDANFAYTFTYVTKYFNEEEPMRLSGSSYFNCTILDKKQNKIIFSALQHNEFLPIAQISYNTMTSELMRMKVLTHKELWSLKIRAGMFSQFTALRTSAHHYFWDSRFVVRMNEVNFELIDLLKPSAVKIQYSVKDYFLSTLLKIINIISLIFERFKACLNSIINFGKKINRLVPVHA